MAEEKPEQGIVRVGAQESGGAMHYFYVYVHAGQARMMRATIKNDGDYAIDMKTPK